MNPGVVENQLTRLQSLQPEVSKLIGREYWFSEYLGLLLFTLLGLGDGIVNSTSIKIYSITPKKLLSFNPLLHGVAIWGKLG